MGSFTVLVKVLGCKQVEATLVIEAEKKFVDRILASCGISGSREHQTWKMGETRGIYAGRTRAKGTPATQSPEDADATTVSPNTSIAVTAPTAMEGQCCGHPSPASLSS